MKSLKDNKAPVRQERSVKFLLERNYIFANRVGRLQQVSDEAQSRSKKSSRTRASLYLLLMPVATILFRPSQAGLAVLESRRDYFP